MLELTSPALHPPSHPPICVLVLSLSNRWQQPWRRPVVVSHGGNARSIFPRPQPLHPRRLFEPTELRPKQSTGTTLTTPPQTRWRVRCFSRPNPTGRHGVVAAGRGMDTGVRPTSGPGSHGDLHCTVRSRPGHVRPGSRGLHPPCALPCPLTLIGVPANMPHHTTSQLHVQRLVGRWWPLHVL